MRILLAWYDLPNATNIINGTSDYLNFINLGVSNWVAPAFLFVIWFVSFGVSLGVGIKKSFMAASFITFLISIYFLRMGMTNQIITIGLLIATILGAILTKSENSL